MIATSRRRFFPPDRTILLALVSLNFFPGIILTEIPIFSFLSFPPSFSGEEIHDIASRDLRQVFEPGRNPFSVWLLSYFGPIVKRVAGEGKTWVLRTCRNSEGRQRYTRASWAYVLGIWSPRGSLSLSSLLLRCCSKTFPFCSTAT